MPTDPAFRMTVQDVFSIKGRGAVVTGQIKSGTLSVGDEIQIQRQGAIKKTVVSGLEMSRKVVTRAQVGDKVGVLLKDIGKPEVERGDVLTGPKLTWKTLL